MMELCEEERKKVLDLYPEYDTIYGPYTRNSDNRKIVVLTGENGARTTRQLAKVRLEAILGRRLVGDETVDHEDKNPENDDPSNLRVLSLSENARRSSLGNQHGVGRVVPFGARQHGEKSPLAKLTNADVVKMRSDFSEGSKTKQDLMEEFGMSDKSIRNALYGQTFKDVPGALTPRVGRPSNS